MEKWFIAGGIGLVVLYFVFREQQVRAPSVIASSSGPATLGQKVQSIADTLGGAGGAVVAKMTGAPSSVSGVFRQQGQTLVGGTVQGFRTAGTGVSQIANGNLVTGTKNVLVGAGQTAYAATGAKGIVSLASSGLSKLGL